MSQSKGGSRSVNRRTPNLVLTGRSTSWALVALLVLMLLPVQVLGLHPLTPQTVSPNPAAVGQQITISGTVSAGSTGDTLTGDIVYSNGVSTLVFCPPPNPPNLDGGHCLLGAGLSFSMTFHLWWGGMGGATYNVQDTTSGRTSSGTFTVSAVLTTNPVPTTPGATLNVQASGFDPGRALQSCTWDGNNLAGSGCYGNWVSANTFGNGSTFFTVPASTFGSHVLCMRDNGGANACTTVLVVPSIGLAPGDGPIGTTVTVTGGGYAANAPFEVIWNPGLSQMVLTSGTTDGAGSIPGGTTFIVPNVPGLPAPGYVVKVLDGAGNSATTNFLLDAQIVTVAPNNGPVGTGFAVTGNGFIAGASSTLNWDPIGSADTGVLGTAVATASGTITFTVHSPPSWNGIHLLLATAPENTATTCFGSLTGYACSTFNTPSSVNLTTSPLFPGVWAGPAGGSVVGTTTYGMSQGTGVQGYLIWDPGLSTQQFVSPGPCPSCVTDARGTIAFPTWNVPLTASPGFHQVEAQDANGLTAYAIFIVGPFFWTTPTSGVVNSSALASGVVFGVGNTVNVNWWHITTPLATVAITAASGGSFGNFTVPITIPTDPVGTYTLWANTTGISTSNTFTIVPSLSGSSSSGTVGSTVWLTAQGLAANSLATVWWDGSNTAVQKMTNALGSAVIAFSIPASPAGAHAIHVEDARTDTTNMVSFTVVPRIVPAVTSAYAGTQVMVSGLGFAASSTVVLSWNGVPVNASSGTSNALGNVGILFTVPNMPGTGSLGAADSSFNTAAPVAFTVWSLAIPTPVSPLGPYVNTSGFYLVWSPVPNRNVTYTVQVSTTATFSSGTTTWTTPGTSLWVTLTDGTWYWRVEGVTAAGGTAGWSAVASFLLDTAPPGAEILPLPAYETSLGFSVDWWASDPGGSGVAGVWIYWSNNSGASWALASPTLVTASPYAFTAPGAGTYLFAAIGQDNAGNRGPFPGAQSTTVVDNMAPSVSLTVQGPHGAGNWYLGATTVTVAAKGSVSGVKATYVSVNGGAWAAYSAPIVLTSNGFDNVSAYAVSGAGVAGAKVVSLVPIDSSVPLTSSDLNSSVGHWYTASPVSATLSIAPVGPSGLLGTYWSVDGSPWANATTFSIAGSGVHTVSFFSVSGAGSVGPTVTQTVRIDLGAPVASVSLSGTAGTAPWYTSAVTVSATATGGPSGVASISIQVGSSASWTNYAGPVLLDLNGATTVSVKATSVAGVTGPTSAVLVQIDMAVPTTSSNVVSSWYTSSPVPIDLNATGGPSGIARTFWNVDGSNWVMGTRSTITGDGVHTLTFYSVSGAGLAEPMHTQTLRIDTTPPRTVASLSGNLTAAGWYGSAVVLTLSASDTTSGVAATYYYNGTQGAPLPSGGVSWRQYSSPMIYTTGQYTVWFRSVDVAGNWETPQSVTFSVDMSATQAPGLTTALIGAPMVWSGRVTYSITLTDPAGLRGAWLQIDHGPLQEMSPATPPSGQTTVAFTLSIDSTELMNGKHTVTVTAVNALGQTSTFGPQRVNVDNPSYGAYALLIGLIAVLVMGLVAVWWSGRQKVPREEAKERHGDITPSESSPSVSSKAEEPPPPAVEPAKEWEEQNLTPPSSEAPAVEVNP